MNNFIHYSKPDTKAGELMNDYRPLQKIDYVNNHKRCDDDLRLAERLATASKYVVGIAVCWIVIIALCARAGYFD